MFVGVTLNVLFFPGDVRVTNAFSESSESENRSQGFLGHIRPRQATEIRRMSETPTTTTSQKSIAIHLQFVLEYASNVYCSAFALRKGEILSGLLPFVSPYASHFYHSTFGEDLGGSGGHWDVFQEICNLREFSPLDFSNFLPVDLFLFVQAFYVT